MTGVQHTCCSRQSAGLQGTSLQLICNIDQHVAAVHVSNMTGMQSVHGLSAADCSRELYNFAPSATYT